MDNVKGVLILLVLVLGASTFLLFVQHNAAKSQLDDAYALGVLTKDFLSAQGVRCSAPAEMYKKVAACISPLLVMDDFREDKFKQPDDKRDLVGYVVIKNTNRKVYDAEEFLFYFNRELSQEGCTVSGDVGFDVTCRFDLPAYCENGDILEAFYPIDDEEIRVFLKTC